MYEVVWCCPITRSFVRCSPKAACFSELRFARSFAKLCPPRPYSFIVICETPIVGIETIAQNTQSLSHALALAAATAETCKWQVVGRSPDDYTVTHMICDGGECLRYIEHAQATVVIDFLKRLPNSIKLGLTIDVVPWKKERTWQEGYAMMTNEFL